MTRSDLHHADRQAMRAIEGNILRRSGPNRFNSVQSHDAAVLSAPAGSAPEAIPATYPATVAQRIEPPASNRAVAGSNPASGSNSNPQASSSQAVADKADAPNSSPDASAANSDGGAIAAVTAQSQLADLSVVEPSPSEPLFKGKPKSLRPDCKRPELCGGYCSRHCHACLVAAGKIGETA